MFKIAKNINTFNEQVNARIVNVEVHNIDHQNNRLINQTLQELEINISGTIDDDAFFNSTLTPEIMLHLINTQMMVVHMNEKIHLNLTNSGIHFNNEYII